MHTAVNQNAVEIIRHLLKTIFTNNYVCSNSLIVQTNTAFIVFHTAISDSDLGLFLVDVVQNMSSSIYTLVCLRSCNILPFVMFVMDFTIIWVHKYPSLQNIFIYQYFKDLLKI